MTYAGVSETKIGNCTYDVCYFSVNMCKEYVCRIFHKGSTKLVCEKKGKTTRAALLSARKAANIPHTIGVTSLHTDSLILLKSYYSRVRLATAIQKRDLARRKFNIKIGENNHVSSRKQ